VYLIPLIALSLTVRLRFYFWLTSSGYVLPQSPDSQWYLDYAHSLMNNFRIGTSMNDILYLGYNLLLTLLLAMFKTTNAVIFVQAVTASVCVVLVYKIAGMLFNRLTAILASIFYSFSWHITFWSMYILSDSFFISLQLLCIYLLLKALDSDKKSYKIAFAASAILLLVFRPTGVLTLFFIAIYVLIRFNKQAAWGFVKKHRLALGGVLAVMAAALVYMVSGDKLAPLISSVQLNAKMVLYNVYAKGWIYDHPTSHDYTYRPEYKINILNSLVLSFIINNWDHILVLYGKRAFAFFGNWVWRINVITVHGLIKFFWNMLPIGLFFVGTYAAIRNKVFAKASILWLISLAVFVFCIITFIDGLYRYKAPAMPLFAIICAYGIDRIIQVVIIFAKTYAGKLLWKKENY
jgi:4-amino-4-deoxy-L-arabinose transferase-like glycosyltransferase